MRFTVFLMCTAQCHGLNCNAQSSEDLLGLVISHIMVTNNRFSFLLLLLVLNAVEGFGQPPSYVPLENLAVWNSLSEVSISAVQADVSNGAFVNDRFGASLEAFETFPSDGSVNVPNSAGGGLMFPLMFQNWFRRCSKRRKSVPIVSTLHKAFTAFSRGLEAKNPLLGGSGEFLL